MSTPGSRRHPLPAGLLRREDGVPPSAVLLGRSLQVLLVVVAAVVAVTEVLRPVLGPAGLGVGRGRFWSVPLVDARLAPTVEVSTTPPLPVLAGGPYGPGEAVEPFVGEVSLQLWTPDAAQRLLLVGIPVLAAAVALAVLVQLFRLAGSLAAGDPFSARSRARLRTVALLVGVAGQAVAVAEALVRRWVLSDDRLAAWVAPDATVSFVPLAVGGVVAVLAHALDVADRRGAATPGPVATPAD
ncbi:DUF2975 domain-containing protein [Pseudokineococcus marinus]|uniref:DUF2975 domain-containing protein n=1 Tax=Pseudokineococcus marinus TaxID=351215 RepID=A0A849BQ21_9ACTN|nr:DUF2975 domain-containing protein [Pseudokineococcus marinus]NNH23087.1 DUF2975 domain-containing protein [Pseudokineococcus marinus]